MRGGLAVAAAVGGALLFAALAGVEWMAARPSTAEIPSRVNVPALVSDTPGALPSVPEVDSAEGLASPAFTR